MKKSVITFFALLFMINVSASSFYDQLCAFNFNWKNHASQAPEGEARVFTSDKEYIQAHLTSVLAILRANPGNDLSKEQFRSRMLLISLLDGYRLVGNFPMNYYRNERIPVFIDEHNTHCAVGYLMQQTGHEDMARRISATDNYVWVKDITDAEVPAWQLASGFSMDELKLIQGAYFSYMPDAMILPNRYEVPQKPECMTAYFEEPNVAPEKRTKWKVWLNGEGQNGVLNGRWEQNYSETLPWITGHYTHGKRSGKWEEYYQGTTQLCRTEFWDNDKLNGIRTRFDRHSGEIIEEILFKDGIAVTKTNFERDLKYVRTPIDSTLVWTDVFNLQGELLASGKETIHNPGNLQWFQNIELTALNSISLSSRNVTMNAMSNTNGNNDLGYQGVDLYAAPPLVEYKKEGEWMYYNQALYKLNRWGYNPLYVMDYRVIQELKTDLQYDSVRIDYVNNELQHFYGFGATDFVHVFVEFYDPKPSVLKMEEFQFENQIQFNNPFIYSNYFQPVPVLKTIGKYNECGQKIGEWKHYDEKGIIYKLETFLVPRDEEAERAAR
jgi:antitoxin component YwqK of YwqJK toxin-antitoxin module